MAKESVPATAGPEKAKSKSAVRDFGNESSLVIAPKCPICSEGKMMGTPVS